jgi:hypothetical protein
MHQPTFLPWLGWWDKFVRADVFVLLDEVQFPKKGGTWINRVRVLAGDAPIWLTVPVDRSYHGFRTVRATLTDESKPWREKTLATIGTSYARAKHFDDVYPVIEEIIGLPTNRIAALDEAGIRRIASELGIDAGKIVLQSEAPASGHGTDLLVALCKAVGGTTYLTGDGAGGYIEPERFAAAGLDFAEQRFTPPSYPQQSTSPVPGLSIIDALMNCGWEDTAILIGR